MLLSYVTVTEIFSRILQAFWRSTIHRHTINEMILNMQDYVVIGWNRARGAPSKLGLESKTIADKEGGFLRSLLYIYD